MPYMKRRQETTDKKFILQDKYYSYRAAPTDKKVRESRAARISQTTEQQKEINKRRAITELAMKIANNFHFGDWYLALTYRARPTSEQAIKDFGNFTKMLKRTYQKLGKPLKYVAVLENLYGRGRAHAHILLNEIGPEVLKKIQGYWQDRHGRARLELFGGEIDDCTRLAAYYKKEDVSGASGRVRNSNGLEKPVEKKERVSRAECYSQQVKVPAGYRIHKALSWQGYTKDGYPCQHTIFVRDEVVNRCSVKSVDNHRRKDDKNGRYERRKEKDRGRTQEGKA